MFSDRDSSETDESVLMPFNALARAEVTETWVEQD